jgi:hypothetical protein
VLRFFIAMLSVVVLNVVAPNQAYYAACHYTECRSAECRGALVLSAYPREKCDERDGKECGHFNKTEFIFSFKILVESTILNCYTHTFLLRH